MKIKDTSRNDKIYGETKWGDFSLTRRHRTYVYPLTIISSRYSGVYSGAYNIAFPLRFMDVPKEAVGSDPECMQFWWEEVSDEDVGYGDTPEEAYQDLIDKIVRAYEES